jgi:DnaJ-class molecular chaperone
LRCSQVKEAFRKLVWQHHPDKAAPEARLAAEAKFKEVRTTQGSLPAAETHIVCEFY